jgi:AraC family transcriptional regulator
MSVKEESVHEYETRMVRVLKYINDNLENDLSLVKLSETACFSQYHFHRLFNSFLGETPNDYVKRLRLEKAANLLIYQKQLSITEIAHKCGFSSSATFARSFKEYFNYNASEWRQFGHDQYTNAINTNSKNCKTPGKNRKDSPEIDSYFYSVNNFSLNNLRNTNLEVEVKIMPALHIAFVVHHEGYNEKIGKAFKKLCRWAGPRGFINKDTKFLGISLDNPDITPRDKCRYYASITISPDVNEEKGIGIMDIPEMKCAVYRFSGTMEEIEPAYKAVLAEWLPQSGYQPGDFPAYEIYLSYPDTNSDIKFSSEVCIPVKPL